MKYLKVFKNASDYQTFKEGSDYITPNICLLEDNYNIVFEPKKKDEPLKQFSIYDSSMSYERKYFNFKEGMTWVEWINSEYCVDWYFYIRNNNLYFQVSPSGLSYRVLNININDKILEIEYRGYSSSSED